MSDDRQGRVPQDVSAAVDRLLTRQFASELTAGLYVTATPIGNLGDLTIRAVSVLARADHVYCEDTRISRRLLDAYGIVRPLKTYHEHNAESVRPTIVAQIAAGDAVALISDAGTPLISDPGYKLVTDVQAAGHPVIAVAGASALAAGASIAGLPTDTLVFAGFLPSKAAARRQRLEALGQIKATLVVYEAPHRLTALLDDIDAVCGDRDVVVAREITKRFESLHRGHAAELAAAFAEAPAKGEIVVFVGPPSAGTAASVSDADIIADLGVRLADASLSKAARATAKALGVQKSRVYELGLAQRSTGDDQTD